MHQIDRIEEKLDRLLGAVERLEARLEAAEERAAGDDARGEEWLDVRRAAARIGVSATTLHRWRGMGEGPPASKVEGTLRYRAANVDAWLIKRAR